MGEESTPAASFTHPEDFASMQHVAHHHAGPQHAESFGMVEPGSGYNTAYGSPGSGQWDHDGAGLDRTHAYPPPGHAPAYEWAEHPESAYPNPYHGYQVAPYGRGTPPTPAASDHSGRITRSTKATSQPKAHRESRSKKAAKPKDKPKTLTMPGPITDLGKESKIELFDIEKYIHRGIDERRHEVAANNGKIKRPMNSYIMYRKVFQERVKEYSKETNHQTISRLVSSSWEQESSDLRDKFAEYAQVERENLMKAYPDYKFQPKAKLAKKRKGDGDSDDLSDLYDSDGEWGAPRSRSRRQKQARRSGHDSSVLGDEIFGSRESSYGWDDGYQYPAYAAANPGRPPPVPMNPAHAHGGYYPQMVSHGLPTGVPAPYADPLAAEGLDPLLGPRVSGIPGMPDALLNGAHQAPMDPLLQEPWSGGAFTSDQFQEYNQYADFGDQGALGFHDGQVGAVQPEAQAAGYQEADLDALLRTSGAR